MPHEGVLLGATFGGHGHARPTAYAHREYPHARQTTHPSTSSSIEPQSGHCGHSPASAKLPSATACSNSSLPVGQKLASATKGGHKTRSPSALSAELGCSQIRLSCLRCVSSHTVNKIGESHNPAKNQVKVTMIE